MNPLTFSDRDDFLAHGLERAECNICREPFDNAHWPHQIRACGHVFGRVCLETWLQWSDSKGTCPQCRSILFGAESDSDSDEVFPVSDSEDDEVFPVSNSEDGYSDRDWENESYYESVVNDYSDYEPDPPTMADPRHQFEALQDRHLRGCLLRLLNICDSTGFLVKLWKEMANAFEPDGREMYVDAWLPRITGLIRYLLEGLGLPDDNRDRTTMALELLAYKAQCLTFLGYTRPRFTYYPFVLLSRNMVQIARLFPRGVIPDPILWRALICFESLGRSDANVAFCDLQQCDELMLTRSTDPNPGERRSYHKYVWPRTAARLYFLLVLMAQDCKYNLEPDDVYDAKDVARLLQSLNTPIMSAGSWMDMPDAAPQIRTRIDISTDFCEHAARFHHGAQIGNPQTVPSRELADPRTRRGLIFCHIRGFWLSAHAPDTTAYDATDDHMRFGIDRSFAGAYGHDDGSEAGDN